MTHIPITGTSNAVDCLLMLVAAWVVSRHIKRSGTVVATVRYMEKYFLFFAVFNALMALPTALVYVRPSAFPAAMGWGYAVANIFLLISLSYLSRMEVRIIPSWATYERLVGYIWIGVNVVMTILNIFLVALSNQPTFNNTTGITQFHIPVIMNPLLAIISLSAYLPGIVLFVRSAIHNSNERARSLFLASGMFLIMIFGPLHAAATSWQLFLAADILNIISLALLASGVLLFHPESTKTAPQPAPGTAQA